MYPYNYARPQGLFGGLRNLTKGVTLGGFLDGAQKTLGVINQAIPIVHQVGPLVANAKTMFKIANVINTPDNTSTSRNDSSRNYTSSSQVAVQTPSDNRPIFYI